MKLYYLAAISLALALILSGFAAPSAKIEPVASSASESLILIPKGEDPAVAAAAGFFADTLGGALGLQLSIMEADNPLAALSEPGVLFAFTKNNERLSILSGPFLFSSYEHFTMALNSKTVLSSVTAELAGQNALPLAAYYTGSDFLLSTVNLDDFTSFRGMIVDGEALPDPESVPLLLLREEDAIRRYAYEKAGSIVEVEPLQSERLRKLLEGEAQIGEFTFSDKTTELEKLDEYLFLTRSWQNTQPLWLMSDANFTISLDSYRKGLLKEAAAALFSQLDEVYLSRERKTISLLDDSHLIMSIDYTRTRRSLSQYTSEAGPEMTDVQKRLLSYVYEIMPS